MCQIWPPSTLETVFRPFPIFSRSSAVKQRGRERKGPPEIIQTKFRLRNWPISSADVPVTPMEGTDTILALRQLKSGENCGKYAERSGFGDVATDQLRSTHVPARGKRPPKKIRFNFQRARRLRGADDPEYLFNSCFCYLKCSIGQVP